MSPSLSYAIEHTMRACEHAEACPKLHDGDAGYRPGVRGRGVLPHAREVQGCRDGDGPVRVGQRSQGGPSAQHPAAASVCIPHPMHQECHAVDKPVCHMYIAVALCPCMQAIDVSSTCARNSHSTVQPHWRRRGATRSWVSWAPRSAPAWSSASTAARPPAPARRCRCGCPISPATSTWAEHVRFCPDSATRQAAVDGACHLSAEGQLMDASKRSTVGDLLPMVACLLLCRSFCNPRGRLLPAASVTQSSSRVLRSSCPGHLLLGLDRRNPLAL